MNIDKETKETALSLFATIVTMFLIWLSIWIFA